VKRYMQALFHCISLHHQVQSNHSPLACPTVGAGVDVDGWGGRLRRPRFSHVTVGCWCVACAALVSPYVLMSSRVATPCYYFDNLHRPLSLRKDLIHVRSQMSRSSQPDLHRLPRPSPPFGTSHHRLCSLSQSSTSLPGMQSDEAPAEPPTKIAIATINTTDTFNTIATSQGFLPPNPSLC
jgi:hypothetical protein